MEESSEDEETDDVSVNSVEIHDKVLMNSIQRQDLEIIMDINPNNPGSSSHELQVLIGPSFAK